MKLAESGSPLAAADAAAALDWARFAQAGRLRTLKLPGRELKLDSEGVTEPAGRGDYFGVQVESRTASDPTGINGERLAIWRRVRSAFGEVWVVVEVVGEAGNRESLRVHVR